MAKQTLVIESAKELSLRDGMIVITASCHTQIIERLRSIIVLALQDKPLNIQSLRDIVDFMRKHYAQFPEFRRSATYKLFEPPIFENK